MSELNDKRNAWMSTALKAVAAFNLSTGLLILIVPSLLISIFGQNIGQDFMAYRLFGMFSAIFGITFLLASYHPLKNWVIVVAGFLSKLFIPCIFIISALNGHIPLSVALVFAFFEIIWLVPFSIILRNVYNHQHLLDKDLIRMFSDDEMYSLDMFDTTEGYDLQEMTEKWPTMVVFLRHMGCSFCKETLADIAEKRNHIELNGIKILLVHMSDIETATETLKQYNLQDLPQISDQEGILYKKFRLSRGSLNGLFGPKVIVRGLANMLKGNKVSKPEGDVFQMPGLFLLKNGKVLRSFIHSSAADRPDYKNFSSIQ